LHSSEWLDALREKEMRHIIASKIFFFFLLLLLPISFCLAAQPVQTTTPPVSLTVIYPKFDSFLVGQNITLHLHLANSSGHYLNGSQASCWYHIYSKDGTHLVERQMVVDGFDYTGYVDSVTSAGLYPVLYWCKSGSEGGFSSFAYVFTTDLDLMPTSFFSHLTTFILILAISVTFMVLMHVYADNLGASIFFGITSSTFAFLLFALIMAGYKVILTNQRVFIDINYYIALLVLGLGLYSAFMSNFLYKEGKARKQQEAQT
jgi:hypothetical protein